jgi:hypothetical protein
VIAPDFDGMTPEEQARHQRWSPGMAVADEVDKSMRGELQPLTEQEITQTAPIVAQTVQAVTGLPAILTKPVIHRALRSKWRLLIGVFSILAAQGFVVALVINWSRLWHFFESGEWLRKLPRQVDTR